MSVINVKLCPQGASTIILSHDKFYLIEGRLVQTNNKKKRVEALI
jgi:hypothetical protein